MLLCLTVTYPRQPGVEFSTCLKVPDLGAFPVSGEESSACTEAPGGMGCCETAALGTAASLSNEVLMDLSF